MNKLNTLKIIGSLAITIAIAAISSSKIYADSRCESVYGGGETCYYNKRFTIEKKVRVEGDDSWKDKVTDVKDDEIIEFKIKITNKSDDDADDFDNMKMEDFLPDELERIGGSGLTEYWDDFESGEDISFVIKARIDSDEFDRDDNFEKCVVNKAEVIWDDEFEGSDTATVCYGDEEPTELPDTGSESIILALAGLSLITLGFVLSKKVTRA